MPLKILQTTQQVQCLLYAKNVTREQKKMGTTHNGTPRTYLLNQTTKMTHFNLLANEVGYALMAFNYSNQIGLLHVQLRQ